jgi:hypothetical protein
VSSPTPVIGVDPGGRETGVILRAGPELIRGVVVVRDDGWADYLADVCGLLDELGAGGGRHVARVMVEEVTPPTGFRRGKAEPINVAGIIGTAMVAGAVLARFPEAILVHAAGHGSGPLAAYPPALVGAREKRGGGRLRHCRSAWDVSYATPPTLLVAAHNSP